MAADELREPPVAGRYPQALEAPYPSPPGAPPAAAPILLPPGVPYPPPPPPGVARIGAPVGAWGPLDVLYSFLLWIGTQVVAGLGVALISLWRDWDTTTLIEGSSPGFVVGMVMVNWVGLMAWPLVVIRRRGSGSVPRDLGLSFEWFDLVRGLVGALAFYALSIAAAIVFAVVTGGDEPPTNTDMIDTGGVSLWEGVLLFLAVAVGTPIVEELWFRGFVMRAFDRRFGLPVSVVVSSLIFGAFHFTFALSGLFIVALLSGFGAVLAMLTVRYRWRLGPAVVAHAINNGVIVVVMLAEPAVTALGR